MHVFNESNVFILFHFYGGAVTGMTRHEDMRIQVQAFYYKTWSIQAGSGSKPNRYGMGKTQE